MSKNEIIPSLITIYDIHKYVCDHFSLYSIDYKSIDNISYNSHFNTSNIIITNDLFDFENTKHIIFSISSDRQEVNKMIFNKYFDRIYSYIIDDFNDNKLEIQDRNLNLYIYLFTTIIHFRYLDSFFIDEYVYSDDNSTFTANILSCFYRLSSLFLCKNYISLNSSSTSDIINSLNTYKYYLQMTGFPKYFSLNQSYIEYICSPLYPYKIPDTFFLHPFDRDIEFGDVVPHTWVESPEELQKHYSQRAHVDFDQAFMLPNFEEYTDIIDSNRAKLFKLKNNLYLTKDSFLHNNNNIQSTISSIGNIICNNLSKEEIEFFFDEYENLFVKSVSTFNGYYSFYDFMGDDRLSFYPYKGIYYSLIEIIKDICAIDAENKSHSTRSANDIMFFQDYSNLSNYLVSIFSGRNSIEEIDEFYSSETHESDSCIFREIFNNNFNNLSNIVFDRLQYNLKVPQNLHDYFSSMLSLTLQHQDVLNISQVSKSTSINTSQLISIENEQENVKDIAKVNLQSSVCSSITFNKRICIIHFRGKDVPFKNSYGMQILSYILANPFKVLTVSEIDKLLNYDKETDGKKPKTDYAKPDVKMSNIEDEDENPDDENLDDDEIKNPKQRTTKTSKPVDTDSFSDESYEEAIDIKTRDNLLTRMTKLNEILSNKLYKTETQKTKFEKERNDINSYLNANTDIKGKPRIKTDHTSSASRVYRTYKYALDLLAKSSDTIEFWHHLRNSIKIEKTAFSYMPDDPLLIDNIKNTI